MTITHLRRKSPMDYDEYLQMRQRKVRQWLHSNIPLANSITNEAFSKILLLSIIDCFAQAYAGYNVYHTTDAFCDFVLSYSSQSKVLNYICPVTLGYDYDLKPSLEDGILYSIDDPYLAQEGERLLQLLPENIREKARRKHRYVGLLYATRNKLVHELNTLGHQIDFMNGKPTIVQGSLIDYVDGKIAQIKEWSPYFPKKYIYDLTIETVYTYLDHCDSEKKMIAPIETRKSRYSWYD